MAERHKTGKVHEPVLHDRICRPGMSKSSKRDVFIDLYLALGDEVLAYEQAGYKCTTQKSLVSASNRLLNDPYVRSEIERRTRDEGREHPLQEHGHAPESMPAIATKEERQRFWTQAMRDPKVDMKHRLKASELLAKTQGDYADEVKVVLVADIRDKVRSLLGLDEQVIDVTPAPAPPKKDDDGITW